MNNLIKAVIWDLGGVLLRTEDPLPRADLAQRLGMSQEELYSIVFSSETANQATIGKISEDMHWDFIRKMFGFTSTQLEAFQKDFWAGDQIDDELLVFIDLLRPRYKTILLSNAWSNARVVLGNRFRFMHVFDFVFFSAELGLAKPDKRIFQYLLKKLCLVAENAVFIDDVPENVSGANQLGMKGIVFKNRLQVIEDLSRLNVLSRVK